MFLSEHATENDNSVGDRLDITPLTGIAGAEIRGVDLHDRLNPETVADIRRALVEYKVIFFPGQHLTSEEHLAFAAQCGEVTEAHPASRGNHGHREMHEIDYSAIRITYEGRRDPLRKPRLDGWHTDVTFMEAPPIGSIHDGEEEFGKGLRAEATPSGRESGSPTSCRSSIRWSGPTPRAAGRASS